MKKFRNIITIGMIVAIITTILTGYDCKMASATTKLAVTEGKPVKAGVLLYRADDQFISEVSKSLQDIQKENPNKVEFIFFDGKNDQFTQNKQLDELLKNGVDLLLVNLVDTAFTKDVVDKSKENNVAVVFFNREPVSIEAIRSYSKACFVGTDAKQAGILQGRILIKDWNDNKAIIDRNGDGIMQYVMLIGERNNIEAMERTKYSVLTINNVGIQTEEVAAQVCDWDKNIAKNTTEALLLRYGDKIEVIISNNDSMAAGAILALQAQGFNKGDPRKTIPIVGVDATLEAQELIKKGYMTGTVLQDPRAMAEALYATGMNLVVGKSAIAGTKYKFDDTGVAIRLPYEEYIPK